MTITPAEQVGQAALSGFAQYESQIAELKRQLEEANLEFNQCSDLLDDALRAIESFENRLAESQAREARLREALENHSGNYKLSKTECAVMNELLDRPHDDTALKEYLDAVIEEFVGKFKRHVGGDGEFWMHELEDFYQNTKAP